MQNGQENQKWRDENSSDVCLRIPADPSYVTTLRLVTASIAQIMGFDIEAIEDLRVCVSEAVNYGFRSNSSLEIAFYEQEEALEIEIRGHIEESNEEGFGLHYQIMEALMDEVKVSEEAIRFRMLR